MDYISQKELMDAAQQGWDNYAETLGLELPDLLGYRVYQPEWTNDVLDIDSPNGTRAELESIWVYAEESGTEGIDGIQLVTLETGYTGTYRCKSGGNNFSGFRMQTAIEKIYQVAWRNFSVIQMTEAITDLNVKIFPPIAVNFPVFTNYQDGLDFSTAMYNYLENPTPENEDAARVALSKSINPGKKKDPTFGEKSEPGGYGPTAPVTGGGAGGPGPTFDGVSDPWVETPKKPGVLSFGLLNIYKCDAGALVNLGRELFPEITWPPTTGVTDFLKWIGEVIIAFSDSIWNKNLIDYIVSVHLLPVDVTAGNLEDIKLGARTMTGILARPISDDVIEIDCGTVHVDEYYTNYVDYMTRCRVYIPFYGMVTIKPEYWQSADIQLKYLWNVMDGSFIAKLYSTVNRHQSLCKVMIGQYSGCACVHMPLSGSNYAAMFSQLAGAAGSLAASATSGNVAVAATSAMSLAGAAGSGGDMQQSNAYNASSAFYGHARPYLTIERPVSHFSDTYPAEKGLPLIVTKTIGSCRGLTICEDPILNFACPDDEAEAIKAALKEGVIV